MIESCRNCRRMDRGGLCCLVPWSCRQADDWCDHWACVTPGREGDCRWWDGYCNDGDCRHMGRAASHGAPGCSRWRPRPEATP